MMEYVKGKTLLQYANTNSPLPEQEIRSIFGQLILAIDFLHKNRVLHRDLKCENVLIDKNQNIRLIDLSFSCQNSILHSTFCGSPGYVAPEIINRKLYGESVDIWSLGIILYAITYGNLPFENQNISMLFKMIISEEPSYPHDLRVSDDLIDLIKKMLIKNPNDRITIEGIKNHQFFNSKSNDKNSIFNQQRINYYIRDPLIKANPEMNVIQKMKLSVDESLKAITDIKSKKISYYSMTYSILFKYFISNEQIKNFSKSYLNSMSLENQNDNSDENIKIGKNEKCRALSRSNSDDLMSSKDNFNIETNNKKIDLKLYLNQNVNFRFNSITKPLGGINIRKRSVSNFKNLTLVPKIPNKSVAKDPNYASTNALPHLRTNLKK